MEKVLTIPGLFRRHVDQVLERKTPVVRQFVRDISRFHSTRCDSFASEMDLLWVLFNMSKEEREEWIRELEHFHERLQTWAREIQDIPDDQVIEYSHNLGANESAEMFAVWRKHVRTITADIEKYNDSPASLKNERLHDHRSIFHDYHMRHFFQSKSIYQPYYSSTIPEFIAFLQSGMNTEANVKAYQESRNLIQQFVDNKALGEEFKATIEELDRVLDSLVLDVNRRILQFHMRLVRETGLHQNDPKIDNFLVTEDGQAILLGDFDCVELDKSFETFQTAPFHMQSYGMFVQYGLESAFACDHPLLPSGAGLRRANIPADVIQNLYSSRSLTLPRMNEFQQQKRSNQEALEALLALDI